LWAAQLQLTYTLQTRRQVLILKARQLGISWLVCGYALWTCLFSPGRNILLFSRKLLEANDLVTRIGNMFARLPEWMREALPVLVVNNLHELRWANGSQIRSLAATEDAGRSFTASILVLDEFAFVRSAKTLYNAAKPTIDGGGQLIVLSTANGVGNLFFELWDKVAQAEKADMTPVFLPWYARPDRTFAWYERARAEAVDPLSFLQEYPATPEEAFVSTERGRFLQHIGWWDACRVEPRPLDGREPLVAAVDAGVSSDSFGVVFAGKGTQSSSIAVRGVMNWIPEPGTELNYRAIREELVAFCRKHNILQIAYDPYQLHGMMQDIMNDEGIWTDAFLQQTDRLIADKSLLDAIKARQVEHDGDDRLRQHLDNANRKLEGNDALNQRLRIVKRRDDLKIDLAVCLSMAHHRAKTDFGLGI
jgi:hypothetical protein